MRVVLDTCVLFSALRSSAGASFRLISSLPSAKFTPVVSAPVFFEYEEVLSRPGQFPHLAAQDIQDFLDYVASVAEHQRVNFLWRPLLQDPDDDMILEAAVSGSVQVIVTHNLRDFAGCERFGVSVLSPSELIRRLKL
jgi:putative PIN family toxin of toxin-antitoxin system